MKRALAESLGTFALVFAGTGAIVVNQLHQGAITHPGVALTFGSVVMAMIYTFGETSGAHFNPAVTLSFAAGGRFEWKYVPPYLAAPVLGALVAVPTHNLLHGKKKIVLKSRATTTAAN